MREKGSSRAAGETTRRKRGLGRRVQGWMRRLINLYPPFLGAGIRVTKMDLPGGTIEARMKLTWWNRNYVGTQYGGSLYSICDPFHLLILIERLGSGYVVWDKAARIHFIRPGRGTVYARIHISDEEIAEVRRSAESEGKVERTFSTQVKDASGQIVAEVEKLVYVRKKE